jgi:aryl-alcohol dehydrogenase-like predicted oxidoreductase
VVVATKGRFPRGDGPNEVGLSRVSLTRALEASLRRLDVDTIDLYQAHAWDPLTPIEETLGFFDDAVRAGKIQYVGVSNFIGWQLQKAALLTRQLGLAPIVTLQPQYNLLQRGVEFELTQVCGNEGIGILPWSPLGGGWLTGKYRRDSQPTGATRLGEDPERGMEAYGRRNLQERTWRVIDAVRSVAEARGVSMAQVALAWLVDRPAVTSVILGARTLEQLDDNLGAAGLHLSAEETALLDQASTPIVDDYPYGELGVSQRDRELPGRHPTGP